MIYPDSRLLIMSKAPDPGTVKTRLIPLLGATGAARLYAQLLDERTAGAVSAGLCEVELWCAPTTGHPFFRDCRRRYGVGLRQQPQGDLGARMQHALSCALRECRSAILIGADCPGIAAADLAEALQALAGGCDAVLGPAADGGYYLIGLSKPLPFLFEAMPWGSTRVLAQTEARLRAHGVRWHRLGVRRDLDTPADYLALRATD